MATMAIVKHFSFDDHLRAGDTSMLMSTVSLTDLSSLSGTSLAVACSKGLASMRSCILPFEPRSFT